LAALGIEEEWPTHFQANVWLRQQKAAHEAAKAATAKAAMSASTAGASQLQGGMTYSAGTAAAAAAAAVAWGGYGGSYDRKGRENTAPNHQSLAHVHGGDAAAGRKLQQLSAKQQLQQQGLQRQGDAQVVGVRAGAGGGAASYVGLPDGSGSGPLASVSVWEH
jgi:hypothetical protein